MSEPEPLDLESLTVADLRAQGRCAPPIVVREDASFVDVVRALSARPQVRTVAVQNGAGALAGIVGADKIGEALFIDLVPGAALGEVTSLMSVITVGDTISHLTAGDFMDPPAQVGLHDSVHDAFVAIHRSNQAGLPVVDDSGDVVAYLDELSLAALWEAQVLRSS